MARFAMISDSPSPSLSLLSLPKEFCPGCSSMYSCSTEAAVAEAHASTSGGASEAIEPDEDNDEEAKMEAERLAAAAVAAAVARTQSYEALSHKRAEGFARQQAAKAACVKGGK